VAPAREGGNFQTTARPGTTDWNGCQAAGDEAKRARPGHIGPGQIVPRAECLANTSEDLHGGIAAMTTRITRHIDAPRARVYRALLDPGAIARWKVPDGMTVQVHQFDPREGGSIRISLTYEKPTGTGKTTPHSDTYHGRFVKLVPDVQVVEVDEFETADPALQGEMTSTITLSDADGGTDLVAVHEGLPPGVSAEDNETGWRMALGKLAALVEGNYQAVS
jgi:uncharacterized protein YndB with AHSA1/START domain